MQGTKLYIADINIVGPAGVIGHIKSDANGKIIIDGWENGNGGQGPTGPTGRDGQDGAQGPIGPIGPAGQDGAQGEIGPIGPMGPAGRDGQDGAQGEIGPMGPAGQDGAQGEMGPTGPTGFISAVGTNYSDYVFWNGSSWTSDGIKIHIGANAGNTEQQERAIALGIEAGQSNQGENAIALGVGAGQFNQKTNAIAIGPNAGNTEQQARAIALGFEAGQANQHSNTIAIGNLAGQFNQKINSIAIGSNAGNTEQQASAIALGVEAGRSNQGENSIAIGSNAGNTEQQVSAIALGVEAGQFNQGENAIAIGSNAGNTEQQASAIALGVGAGRSNQHESAIALGLNAGFNEQKSSGIAIGKYAGQYNQQSNAIAIGSSAGDTNQGNNSIAIGNLAGVSAQEPNTIILNATGTNLNSVPGVANALYINPIRNDANSGNFVLYNSDTKEVTYGALDGETGPHSLAYYYATDIPNLSGGIKYQFEPMTVDSSNSYGGMEGYSNGRFINNTSSPMALMVEWQISADQGNWDVELFKGKNDVDENIWQNQILATYNNNSFSQTVILGPSEYCYVKFSISGPSTYTLKAIDSRIQFTRLDKATGAKTFVIEHPTDKEKYLIHGCLEGPEVGIYYRGKSMIPESGEVIVTLPSYVSYFGTDFTVNLTSIYKGSRRSYPLESSEVYDGSFKVYGEPGPFHWTVFAKRDSMMVEPYKSQVEVKGQGPYTYV